MKRCLFNIGDVVQYKSRRGGYIQGIVRKIAYPNEIFNRLGDKNLFNKTMIFSEWDRLNLNYLGFMFEESCELVLKAKEIDYIEDEEYEAMLL